MADDSAGDDDAERLRRARREAEAEATRPPGTSSGGAPCVVGKVTSGSTVGGFWTLAAQTILGAEADGGAGSLSDAGWSFKALNLGATAPPTGTVLLCTFTPFRWTFRYG